VCSVTSANLNDLTLGGYIPGDSLLHRLDPRAKFLCFFLLMITAFGTSHGAPVLPCLCASISLSWAAHIGFRVWYWVLKRFAWLLGLAGGLNLFLKDGREIMCPLGIVLPFTLDGLLYALFFATQLAVGIAFSIILTSTTKPEDIVRALARLARPLKSLKLPVEEGLQAMLMALRFAPMLQEELRSILEAQRARGVNFKMGGLRVRAKTLSSIVGPALIGTLRRGDQLAVAMAARGFRPGQNRSEFRPLVFSGKDLVAVVGTSFFAFSIFGLEVW